MTAKKDWQAVFLDTLAETGNVTSACRKAKVSRTLAYQYKNDNPDFFAQWTSALQLAIDSLEEVAVSRAIKYSDTLLIFLLKSHRPEKYRENSKIELTGKLDIDHHATAAGLLDSLIHPSTETNEPD